jgi:aminoglycoside/choline kinase family phosphotransferase
MNISEETTMFEIAERQEIENQFLAKNKIGGSQLISMSGDASKRIYKRIQNYKSPCILMNADPTLGEEPRTFAAISTLLQSLHLSAPKIYQADIDNGFLLLEDLGDNLYTKYLNKNILEEETLYKAALDVLDHIHKSTYDTRKVKLGESEYIIPHYTLLKLMSEIKLFLDWYFPGVTGRITPHIAIEEFYGIMRGILPITLAHNNVLCLRDYHADNLIWLNDKEKNIQKVGLLDYQDAVIGNPAYDIVSLLQDARRDLAKSLEEKLLVYYMQKQKDEMHEVIQRDYIILGAQRNIKILGIFARLVLKAKKKQYADYLPRVWQHLEHDLEFSTLKPLKNWFDRWLPTSIRYSELRIWR